jgi:hypothetical protein
MSDTADPRATWERQAYADIPDCLLHELLKLPKDVRIAWLEAVPETHSMRVHLEGAGLPSSCCIPPPSDGCGYHRRKIAPIYERIEGNTVYLAGFA